MEIDLPDYYRSATDEALIKTGRGRLEEVFQKLRQNNKSKIVQEVAESINDEICALLGLAISHKELSFTPATLATVRRHKIGQQIFHICYVADEAEHPLLEDALKLQDSIMKPV